MENNFTPSKITLCIRQKKSLCKYGTANQTDKRNTNSYLTKLLFLTNRIHFRQFSLEVYFTIVLLGLLYFVYSLGFHVKALGKYERNPKFSFLHSKQSYFILSLSILFHFTESSPVS